MLIRSFETRDLEQCTKLIKETSEQFNREDFTQGNEKEFFDFFDLKKNKEALIKFFNESTVFVAINQKDEIMGVLRVEKNRIKSFFVVNERQRKGVATALFNYYLNTLKKGEYKNLTVLSSTYAVKFYESLGFVISGDDIIRGGKIRVIPMEKILT